MAIQADRGIEVQKLNEKEAHRLFDEIVRRELGISAGEFLERWAAGEYRDLDGEPGALTVYMAMPLVRDVSL